MFSFVSVFVFFKSDDFTMNCMCGVEKERTLACLHICSEILQGCVGITDRERWAGGRAVLRNVKEAIGYRGLEYCGLYWPEKYKNAFWTQASIPRVFRQ